MWTASTKATLKQWCSAMNEEFRVFPGYLDKSFHAYMYNT